MSWLRSLNYKRFLKIPRLKSILGSHRFSLAIRWNQTTKIGTGLLASILSLLSLLTFFDSMEHSASVNPSASEAASLAFELGASDNLSREFGLNANLPIGESELATSSGEDPSQIKSVIKTVSVQQVEGTAQNESNVRHAVGHELENQNPHGQVKQIVGERPVFINSVRPTDNSSRSTDVGAVWLTGEIEETDDLPVNASARRVKNY